MPAKFRVSFFAASPSNDIEIVDTDNKGWRLPIQHIIRLLDNFACIDQTDTSLEDIQVLFVSGSNLSAPMFFQNLSGDPVYLNKCRENKDIVALRQTYPFGGKPDPSYRPAPVITIGPHEVMHIYEEAPPLEFETTPKDWKKSREEDRWLYRLNLDHRLKFLDSSIWHRYIPYDDNFDMAFVNLVKTITSYADKNLYKSLASIASLEFQCRMLQHSFIHKFGENGHNEAVTPFKFHSETQASKKIEKFTSFFAEVRENEKRLSDIVWNVLLIDDYSKTEISTIDSYVAPTKESLVQELLEQCRIRFSLASNSPKENVISEGVKHLQVRKSTFDLILLDYLLGDSEIEQEHKAYGHEFLLELAMKRCNRGPSGRYWFILSSSFPFAFSDKLRQLSIDGSTERWHISNGGDPISTPEMYKLRILRILLRQISEHYLFESALIRQIDRYDGLSEIGQWCNALITRLKEVMQIRKSLESERDRKSSFAETMEDFLSKQDQYENFLKSLEEWLKSFKKYRIGHSSSKYLDNLLSLSEKFPAYSSVCNHIQNKAQEFIHDRAQELKDAIISGLPEITLTGPGKLFSFPDHVPDSCTNVKRLYLSDNLLINLPLSITQFSNLEILDLSNNPDLQYLHAKEMLIKNKYLKSINLNNTKIGDKMLNLDECPVFSDSLNGTLKILRYISENSSRLNE